jgi:alginate O-acetyltransferase complex protein AlgI
LGTAATFVLVMVGWVPFRAPTLEVALHYLRAMFGLGEVVTRYHSVASYLTADIICYLLLGLVFALAPLGRLHPLRLDRTGLMAVQLGLAFVSLVYSLLLLAANSFNPFIYFRF